MLLQRLRPVDRVANDLFGLVEIEVLDEAKYACAYKMSVGES